MLRTSTAVRKVLTDCEQIGGDILQVDYYHRLFTFALPSLSAE